MRILSLGILAVATLALVARPAAANDCCFDKSRVSLGFLECKAVPGTAPTGNPNCWSCAGLQIFFPDYDCNNQLNNCNSNPGPVVCTLRPGPVGNPSCQWQWPQNIAVGCNGNVLIEPASIPTMSEWGMIAMAALLLVAGVWMLRRRTSTPELA